jgi:hypothetical protein
MKPINRFTLEKHDGPYEKWPLRSRLFLDGKPTDLSLPGYARIDARTFIAFIGGSDHCWRLSVRSWGIPYIRPRLKLQRVDQAVVGLSAPRRRETTSDTIS